MFDIVLAPPSNQKFGCAAGTPVQAHASSTTQGSDMQIIGLETNAVTASLGSKQRSAPLEPQVADRLLDLLASGDTFRELFTRNPGEALAQVGFVNTTDAPSPQICFWGIELASKKEIARARDEIRLMLTRGAGLYPAAIGR